MTLEQLEEKKQKAELAKEDFADARADFLIELRWLVEVKALTLPRDIQYQYDKMEERRLIWLEALRERYGD